LAFLTKLKEENQAQIKKEGHLALMMTLNSCHLEARFQSGYTPLQHAVADLNQHVVRTLLDFGANANARTTWKGAECGTVYLAVTALVRSTAQNAGDYEELGRNSMNLKASEEIVCMLVQHGALVQPQLNPMSINSPLLEAIRKKSCSMVKLLIKKGAELNRSTEDGTTPLMLAVESNHSPSVKYLLKHGAAVDQKNGKGDTALLCAVRQNKHDMAIILLDCGASLVATDKDGNTPRAVAENLRRGQIRQTLLDRTLLAACAERGEPKGMFQRVKALLDVRHFLLNVSFFRSMCCFRWCVRLLLTMLV
jgi:ankyrin repeat protein